MAIAIDGHFRSRGITRKIVWADGPPSPPPKSGYWWNELFGFWQEFDDRPEASHVDDD